jgi:hypothetical protein
VHPRLTRMVLERLRLEDPTGLHAGALLTDAGAWVVIGPRFSGKSTIMHAAWTRGLTILSDDVALIADGDVLAGPRCLDLRVPEPGTVPVRGDRYRVTLPPTVARAPLAGFVHLAWEDGLTGPRVRRLGPAERLERLVDPERADAVPVQAVALLDLVTVDALVLERPRDTPIAASAATLWEALGV